MSARSERIRSLIEKSEKSYQELERLTGIKKSSLQRYASGVTTKIPLDVIEKLSKAFNVSPAYIMGWTEKKTSPSEPELTEGDREILEVFRLIPEEWRQVFLEQGRAFAKSLKKD